MVYITCLNGITELFLKQWFIVISGWEQPVPVGCKARRWLHTWWEWPAIAHLDRLPAEGAPTTRGLRICRLILHEPCPQGRVISYQEISQKMNWELSSFEQCCDKWTVVFMCSCFHSLLCSCIIFLNAWCTFLWFLILLYIIMLYEF